MHSRIYIDTNVIVDLFDEKRISHYDSLNVIKKIFEEPLTEVFINTDTLTNLFYILRSHIKLNFHTAIEKMVLIKDGFHIISYNLAEIESALALCQNDSFKDYEDAMQYVCAIQKECTLIVTNNPKDFKNTTIDVVTSQELNTLWNQ
jgi:predicted nucleic acid-binding protein